MADSLELHTKNQILNILTGGVLLPVFYTKLKKIKIFFKKCKDSKIILFLLSIKENQARLSALVIHTI